MKMFQKLCPGVIPDQGLSVLKYDFLGVYVGTSLVAALYSTVLTAVFFSEKLMVSEVWLKSTSRIWRVSGTMKKIRTKLKAQNIVKIQQYHFQLRPRIRY